jgi:hypothetical protein
MNLFTCISSSLIMAVAWLLFLGPTETKLKILGYRTEASFLQHAICSLSSPGFFGHYIRRSSLFSIEKEINMCHDIAAKRVRMVIIFLFFLCFLVSGLFYSQTTVKLEGVVTDNERIPLPGVILNARNKDTGYIYSAITSSNGHYVLSGIVPGKYEIEVSLEGFSTLLRKGLTLNVGAILNIDFTLNPAAIEEEVVVVGESPMVEVTKSEISSVVDRNKIDMLPLYDRDYSSLVVMKAGVGGGRTAAQPRGGGEALIDGVSNEILGQNTIRTRVPADAIQEFRVITNSMQPEYGNAAGLVQSAITRSGTNEFRGRLSFFYRDEAFDAVNYFINHDYYNGPKLDESEYEKPQFEHINFGGFLGGPIIRDKLHFFIVYDGFRHTDYSTVNSPLVPKESVNIPSNTDQVLIKLNFQPNENHLFTYRYSHDNTRIPENGGVGGFFTKSTAYTFRRPMNDFQLNWTFYPSDKTMNEVRILYSNAVQDADTVEDPNKFYIIRPSGYFGPRANYPQQQTENRFNIVENFSIFAGDHSIKLGIDAAHVTTDTEMELYMPGYFYFGTDEPFNPSDFSTYPLQLVWNNSEEILFKNPFTLIGIFIQDSWRIHPQFTLNYGIRYNYYDAEGFDINHTNIRNFNPRIGFSWDPVGDGKTQIRGGFGTYSNNPILNAAQITSIMGGLDIRAKIYPGYPDPYSPNPFFPIDYTVIPPSDVYGGVENQIAPFTIQATLGAQREFVENLSIGLDLVWAGGRHIMRLEQFNPVIPGTGYVRQDPTQGNVFITTDRGETDYKAVYVTLNKRYSNGWSLEVSYTLSRSYSHLNNNENVYPDSYEPDSWERAWGPVDRDARHRLAVTGIVDLPLGFQLSGLFYYRSKYPWNAVYQADLNLDSLSGDYVDQQRNSRRGYDSLYLNFRLSKFINVKRFRIHPFIEVYNVTNRVNFTSVYPFIDGTRFGEPVEAGSPRLLQFGIRVDF